MHDKVIDTRNPDSPPAFHQTVTGFLDNHYVSLLIKFVLSEVQHTLDEFRQGKYKVELFYSRVTYLPNGLPQLG